MHATARVVHQILAHALAHLACVPDRRLAVCTVAVHVVAELVRIIVSQEKYGGGAASVQVANAL